MESTRQSALRAAATILADEGFPALTLERVAKAVDVKAASLYHHFSSRDELVTEVMLTGVETVVAEVAAAVAAVPPEQHLRRIETAIHTHFDAVREHQPFTVANLRNVDQLPDPLRSRIAPHNRQLDELWQDLFVAAATANVFPPTVNGLALKKLVMGAMTTATAPAGEGRPTHLELASQLVELIRSAAIGPTHAASALLGVDIEGHVGLITLGNPPVNALTEEMVQALGEAIEALTRSHARVVIIQSSLTEHFCGGADLALLRRLDPAGFETYLLNLRSTFERLANAPFPSIAVINGPAIGCGLELALACTFRVAATTATFAIPEITMGLSPGAGTTQRLPRLVGQQVALDLVLTGRTVDAAEAHVTGLIDQLHRRDLDAAAITWADQLAQASRETLAAALRSVRDSGDQDSSRAELREAVQLFDNDSDSGHEGIEEQAASISNHPAEKKGSPVVSVGAG